MAKSNSTAATINPLIDEDDPLETIRHAEGVIWFLTFTASDLADGGSNEQATHGLTMVMECVANALSHAGQALQPKALKHA